MSGKTGKDWKLKKSVECLPEIAGCIPSAVVIMTTADRMHPTFSGRHTYIFIISDLYRVVTEIAEVNTDIAQSVLKCIIPLLP